METPVFPLYVYRDILDAQGQISVVAGPIWPTFEFIQDIMHVLVTCKLQKYRINKDREKVETDDRFLDVQGQLTL